MSNYAESPKLLAFSSRVNLFHGRRQLSFLDLIANSFFLLFFFLILFPPSTGNVSAMRLTISPVLLLKDIQFSGPYIACPVLFFCFFSEDTGRFQTARDRLLLITVIFAMFFFFLFLHICCLWRLASPENCPNTVWGARKHLLSGALTPASTRH